MFEDEIEKYTALQISKEGRSKIELVVAKEFHFTIFLNGAEFVTLLCSSQNLEYLTAGFLESESLIKSKDDVKNMMVDPRLGVAHIEIQGNRKVDGNFYPRRLIASGCGGGAIFYNLDDANTRKIESTMKISADVIFALVNEFQHGSQLYLVTHGIHSAALADRKSILIFSEDIGRHNAVDKLFGKCLLEGESTGDKIIISSGRISSEILYKVAKRGIPILISISVPTSLGLKAADELGITLIGNVKGKKMNVYTHDWRVS